MSEKEPFDPGKYLTKVSNADYLEVKWRLVWLHEVGKDIHIDTELVSHKDSEAVFKATISCGIPDWDDDGNLRNNSATGYGSEAANDFRDYLEKAETKAIGRALAALGFGTQFCPDHEFGAAQGKVVDSPIDFSSTRGRQLSNAGGAGRPPSHAG